VKVKGDEEEKEDEQRCERISHHKGNRRDARRSSTRPRTHRAPRPRQCGDAAPSSDRG